MKKIIWLMLGFSIALSAIAQSGGGYNLEQNVIGNGGWRSDGTGFTVLGTMGQGNAGSTAAGGGYHLIDGLWATENPVSGSPFAVLTGRVVRANGVGMVHAHVTATNQTTGQTFSTFTVPPGVFRFGELPTGANYLVVVSRRPFIFEPESAMVFISGDRSGVDFMSTR